MIFILKIVSHYFHVLKLIRGGEIETFCESVPPVHGSGGELHNV